MGGMPARGSALPRGGFRSTCSCAPGVLITTRSGSQLGAKGKSKELRSQLRCEFGEHREVAVHILGRVRDSDARPGVDPGLEIIERGAGASHLLWHRTAAAWDTHSRARDETQADACVMQGVA
jgi:hypothetical protein